MAIAEQTRSDTGPVLSDGTPLTDLIDTAHREVSMRLLSDPEVYRLELERLFARSWTVVAHESEVPRAGDFVTRYIGQDSVIVARDGKGSINVMLNVCAHRGMKVCRVEAGCEQVLKCAYHGWAYDPAGRFLGAPVAQEQMHGNIRSKQELGLVHARTDTFAGMVFATWDPTAPTLDDFIGDAKWYMELMFDRTDDGLEVLGPPQRFVIPANWKCPAEQHNVDGYHTLSLHRSLFELGLQTADPDDNGGAMTGVNVSANGHGLRCIDQRESYWSVLKDSPQGQAATPLQKLQLQPPPGMSPDMVPRLAERFDEGQLRTLADFPPSVGGMFPNAGIFSIPFPTADGMAGLICWHSFVPRGPDRFEFFNWYFVERSASDEMRERMSKVATFPFGVSGFVETDDADTWPQMTESAQGVMGRHQKLRYQALTGEDQPMPIHDWPGGGHVYPGFTKDDAQWRWWLRYRDFMVGVPW